MRTGGELLGLPAVADRSGRRLGVIVDVLFDDRCTRVIGVVIRRGRLFGRHEVIGFSAITTVDCSAVLVGDRSVARAPTPEEVHAMSVNRRAMQGKPVVSRRGTYMGQVADVLFNEGTGDVVGFTLGEPARAGRRRPRAILPADLNPVIGRDVVIGS
jgi:uncharacterized protein YrrD